MSTPKVPSRPDLISYSYNWNNKLDCSYHTVIRIRNDNKYKVGDGYDEELKGTNIGRVQCVGIKHLYLSQLTDYIINIDMGLSLTDGIAVIKKMWPWAQWDTQQLSWLMLRKLEVKINDKVALFCRMYSAHLKDVVGEGLKYKVSKADIGKLKPLSFDEPLLRVYFTSANFLWKNRYSVSNFAKYYNELRAEAAGANVLEKWPSVWDPVFVKSLTPHRFQDYCKHLKDLGLTPVWNQSKSSIIDFK